MNTNNNEVQEMFSVEELESRFEMEMIAPADPDWKCTCTIED